MKVVSFYRVSGQRKNKAPDGPLGHPPFEKETYRLKETCEHYLRRDVTGEGFSGSPFLDQLNADDRALKELEKRLEPWWDIYQRW